VVCTKETN